MTVLSKRQERLANTPMRERAKHALYRTWSAICYDILDCTGNPETAVLNQDEVIDAVLACGTVGGYPEMYGEDDEAVKWMTSLPYDEVDKIAKEAFPHARYGL